MKLTYPLSAHNSVEKQILKKDISLPIANQLSSSATKKKAKTVLSLQDPLDRSFVIVLSCLAGVPVDFMFNTPPLAFFVLFGLLSYLAMMPVVYKIKKRRAVIESKYTEKERSERTLELKSEGISYSSVSIDMTIPYANIKKVIANEKTIVIHLLRRCFGVPGRFTFLIPVSGFSGAVTQQEFLEELKLKCPNVKMQ